MMQVLNVLVLEGVFINNENRAELSEALNLFNDTNMDVTNFACSLKPDGSVGKVFQKQIDERVRTLKGQSLIDSVVNNAEASVRSWEMKFCDSVRTMERVFHGILDDDNKVKGYDSLQNLMTLKGRENREYRDNLAKVRESLNQCREILAEIEPLDMPKK